MLRNVTLHHSTLRYIILSTRRGTGGRNEKGKLSVANSGLDLKETDRQTDRQAGRQADRRHVI